MFSVGSAAWSAVALAPAGNATQAIRVVIPVTTGDAAAQVTVDHVVARSGRSLATITFEGRVEATRIETIDEVTAVAAAKLPA